MKSTDNLDAIFLELLYDADPISEDRSFSTVLSPIRYSVGRKAKNCKKGKPCGGSCQSKTNVCFVGLSADQKSLALKARKAMQGGGGGIASELPSSPPTDFNFKQKTKLVGSGAYGEVRVTKDPPPVAIKKGAITDDEIEILERLSDSGVTPKFIAANKGKTQVAMEFIDGSPIHVLKGDEADDAYISAHSALAKIHRAGISHEDVGDENILVRKDKSVVFVDFGLAGMEDPYPLLTEAMGIPNAKDSFPTVNFKSPRVKEFSDLQDANRKKLISVLKKDGIKVKYTKSWGVDFLDYSEAISPQNLQRYLDIMYEGIE
jgi:hypothetical protein